ncbi:MAG: YicC family protein [Methylococcales bacterium]|nr:YicC family protein [Methylococcales bacterium]
MIKSMTAYACNEAEISDLIINCEIRSVNHRYSDVSLKLPEALRFMETDLRALMSGQIKRGKLDCTISYKKPAKQRQGFIVNHNALAVLLAATEQIEVHMMTPQPFSALDVLAFPGILQEPTTDKTKLNEGVTQLVKQTVDDLLIVRAREGAQLKTLVESRCQKIHGFAVTASQRIPVVMLQIRNKLKDKIVELVAQPDFDRLEQELVYLVQKMDVSEELDRLETHAKEVLRVLNEEEPAGKRLDFLMQELNREANTLGSKSVDTQISQIAIELKVLIEQMREQIQNIE